MEEVRVRSSGYNINLPTGVRMLMTCLCIALLSWAATNMMVVVSDAMILFGPELSCAGDM